MLPSILTPTHRSRSARCSPLSSITFPQLDVFHSRRIAPPRQNSSPLERELDFWSSTRLARCSGWEVKGGVKVGRHEGWYSAATRSVGVTSTTLSLHGISEGDPK